MVKMDVRKLLSAFAGTDQALLIHIVIRYSTYMYKIIFEKMSST